MNQTPCASIYGTCARITKPHIKTHARHKSRGPRPTIQPSPAPTIQSVHGNSNNQGSRHKHTRKKRNEKKNKIVTRMKSCRARREQTSEPDANEFRKPEQKKPNQDSAPLSRERRTSAQNQRTSGRALSINSTQPREAMIKGNPN